MYLTYSSKTLVFAKTKVHVSSLIQTLIPTLLESCEKEASILHLNLLLASLINFTFPSCPCGVNIFLEQNPVML